MIKRTDIYAAINFLLKSKYPQYKTQGHEVTEGYKKPSFFVDLIPRSITNESVNFKKYSYTAMVTYFQETADEIDNLTKVDEIQELFGYHLKVGSELFPITGYSYDFVGEYTNILQISVDFEYIEYNEKQQKPVAGEITIKVEKR